jgi:hypothetical protein
MTEGRLIQISPSFASKVPVSTMQDEELRASISYALAKMSRQTAPNFNPQSSRKSSHPGLVTDHCMNIITALGENTDATRIMKHTRDEVIFKESAPPWRRSQLWLLIRVSLQLLFNRACAEMPCPDQL